MGFEIKKANQPAIFNPTQWHMLKNTHLMIAGYTKRISETVYDINRKLTAYCGLSETEQEEQRTQLIEDITKQYQEQVVNTYFRAQANIWLMKTFYKNNTADSDVKELDTSTNKSMNIFVKSTDFLGHNFVFTQQLFHCEKEVPETNPKRQSPLSKSRPANKP